jgi:hypothetical protein
MGTSRWSAAAEEERREEAGLLRFFLGLAKIGLVRRLRCRGRPVTVEGFQVGLQGGDNLHGGP